MPGSWIMKEDGTREPNLNDEAMAARLKSKKKEEAAPAAKSKEVKTDAQK